MSVAAPWARASAAAVLCFGFAAQGMAQQSAVQRGDFPVRRVGRRLFVPVPALKRWLGVDLDATAPRVQEKGSAAAGS